ncbi:hypothetical protein C7S15_7845 [Burkholderia cepacia]|nr:hypothetical protein [Burkholderia cepacia]
MALFEGYTTFAPYASRSILHVEDRAGKGTQTQLRLKPSA